MNEDQALQVCGCFALGLDVGFRIFTKYYCVRFDDPEGCKLSIADFDNGGKKILHFDIADVSVNDNCLVIDLLDFQIRIDLDGDAA